jgi:hypothetical protein
MDTAEYAIMALNLLLALGCGWPLAALLARVSAKPDKAFRYLVLLVLVYIAECIAFSAGMATNVLSVALAFVWGNVLGRWFGRWKAELRVLVRAALFFSLYSALPAASFISIPAVMALSGRSVLSAEEGFLFGVPAFVPWPVNTILGFSLFVVIVAVVFKVVITTGLARALIVRSADPVAV